MDYINSLLSLGCKQLVDFITHPNPVNSSLIDHIYTNSQNKTLEIYPLKEDITDHLPIIMNIKNIESKNFQNNIKNKTRDMKNFSVEKFNRDLLVEFSDFNHILNTTNDIDHLFYKFISKFKTIID